MKHFLFDVDGTLTPSRQTITPEFKDFFLEFCKTHKCHLVTGSDRPKTLEQLGKEICDAVITIYNCSGNDVWFRGQQVNKSDWKMSPQLKRSLEHFLKLSGFKLRTGNHIEERIGSLNFSVVGRNADLEQRKSYVKYDQEKSERVHIANHINLLYDDLEVMVGGETGVDIYPKGKNKSQVIDDFGGHELYFFGDAMQPSGNDYPLAQAILDNNMGKCYHVKDYLETWQILKGIYE